MGFFGTLGKLAGGVAGFAIGGPAGAVAGYKAVSSLGGRPQILPTYLPQGLTGQTPFVGGASGGFAADSAIVTNQNVAGLYNRTRMAIYGPRAGAQISSYPVGGGGPVDGQAGGNVMYQVPSCPMPVGRGRVAIMPSPCSGYHWNRGRYYVFGDCRTGTGPAVIEPGTRLVRNRRINPANASAARRAARRLNGTLTLLRSIERSTARLVRRSARHSGRGGKGSARAGASCKCK